jgi:hypothetical protein
MTCRGSLKAWSLLSLGVALSACGPASLQSDIVLPTADTVCVIDSDCVLLVDGCACEPGSLLAVRADAVARVEDDVDLRLCPALADDTLCGARAVYAVGRCAIGVAP